jgi:GDP-D-mannose dehydratase
VDLLIGDYAKAKRQLGWEPKVGFAEGDLHRRRLDQAEQGELVAKAD